MSTSGRDMAQRATLIDQLFTVFPRLASPKRAEAYTDQVRHVPLEDLLGAVNRLASSWDQSSPPPLAILIQTTKEVRTERLEKQLGQKAIGEPKPRPLTTDELDQCRMVNEMAKGELYWCCLDGRFMRGGLHRSAEQAYRANRAAKSPTRQEIHQAYQRFQGDQAEGLPF